MKITKKLISVIMAFSLCAAMLYPAAVWADDDDGESPEATPEVTLAPDDEGGDVGSASERKLYVDFMGIGPTPVDTGLGNAGLNESDEQKEFWVGVAVDKVNDLALFKEGVYSLELAFEYNTKYIEPYTASGTTWKQEIIKGNLSDANNEAWWQEDMYEVKAAVTSTNITSVTDREDMSADRDRALEGEWKMCTVCISLKDDADIKNGRFYGLEGAGKQYLVKLPFKLKYAPRQNDLQLDPKVLYLVRGPETLNIGAGEDGINPYSAWETTLTNNTPTNMKTLFTFDGDIYLFRTTDVSDSEITDIIPVKQKSGTEASDTEYPIYRSSALSESEKGFRSATYDYYLSVPNETKSLKLKIKAAAKPTTISANGSALGADYEDDYYVTEEFDLNEVDMSENDGFNNTIVVDSYIIHIRRLLEPKIVLNYGNSPVGMIMSDDDTYPTEYDKEVAIENFTNTRIFSGVTPNRAYYTDAWTSYIGFDEDEEGNPVDYDGDLDPTAIFIFQRKSFRDPGFTVYNAIGEEITDQDVKIELTMTTYGGGVATYNDTTDKAVELVENQAYGSGFLFTKFVDYNIRPDVYRMIYTFTDSSTGRPITVERKVIAISQLGDVQINSYDIVNDNDAADIISHVNSDFSDRNEKRNSLYTFRVADVNIDSYKVINDNDAAEIISNLIKGFGQFYNALSDK